MTEELCYIVFNYLMFWPDIRAGSFQAPAEHALEIFKSMLSMRLKSLGEC